MANTKVKAEQLEAAQTNITSVGTLTGLALSGSLTGTSATFTTADNTSQLVLKSTDADASLGPRMDLIRDSSSPAANDYLGVIRWMGEDDAGNSLGYAHMSTYISDPTDGAEDGKFEIDTRVAGTMRSRLLIHSTSTIFNQESLDVDFRIESNNKSAMFFIDAGNDRIGIGTDTPTQMLALDDSVDGEVAVKIQNDSTGSSAFASLYLQGQGNNFKIKNWGDGTSKANITEFVSTAGSSEFLFTPANSEELVLNSTGLYPYTDVGLELGDANNRWNRLEVKSTTSGNIHFEGVDTTAASAFRTFEVTTTLSGSDATGADRANYGIYNQVDSSATGGDTSDEHRVYGMRNLVKVTGDSDLVYGVYNSAEAEHSSGTVSLLYGAYNYAIADPDSGGTVTNMYGAYNYAVSAASSGSTVTNVYAGYNKALTSGNDDIGHTSLTACYAEIENDDSGQQNTTTTGYLFRGVYDDDSGTNNLYTNFYGLHIGGSGLSGNLTGSGDAAGVYLALAGLDVGFWNNVDQLNYFRGSLAIGSGSKNVANTVGMELHLVEPQGGDMIFARNDSATTTNEVLGRIFFGATEDSGNTVNYGTSIEAYAGGPQSASDSEGYLMFKTTPNNSTTLTERMRIKSNGDVEIGRVSGSTDYGITLYHSGHLYQYADASGNSDAYRLYDASGTNTAAIDADGDFMNPSDERYKENIVDASSVLSTISDIKVRSFTWKESGRKQSYGFVAQELNEVAPEAVSPARDDEDIWSIKHAKMIPMLTKAIQEQQAQIEALQAEVKALKGG